MRSPLSLLSSLYFKGFTQRLRDSFLTPRDKKEIVANLQGCTNPHLINVWSRSATDINAWALEASVTVAIDVVPPPIIAIPTIQTPRSSPRSSPAPETTIQSNNHISSASPIRSAETPSQSLKDISPSATNTEECATPSEPTFNDSYPVAPLDRPISPKGRRFLRAIGTKSTTEKPRPRTPTPQTSIPPNTPVGIRKKSSVPRLTNVKKVNRPPISSATDAQKVALIKSSAILSAVNGLPLDRKPFGNTVSNQLSPRRDILAEGVLSYKFAKTPEQVSEYQKVLSSRAHGRRRTKSASSTPLRRSQSASPNSSSFSVAVGRVSKVSEKDATPKTPLKLRVNELYRRASLPHSNPMMYLGMSSGLMKGGHGYVDVRKVWQAEEEAWANIR